MNDDALVLGASLEAFGRAVERHRLDIAEAHTDRSEQALIKAFGSLVECAFWSATLDTQLVDRFAREWKSRRDTHLWSREVLAMLWARDRLYHQLPFSIDRDETPFYGHGRPETIFYITPVLMWKDAESLSVRGERSKPEWRAAFTEVAAGKGTLVSFARAHSVFQEIIPVLLAAG